MDWWCMGFGLSYHKGQFGDRVAWVGYEVVNQPDKIQVETKEELMKGLE